MIKLKLSLIIKDIEWKLIYVGSASNEKYDQLLESVLVGPVPCGIHKFILQVLYKFNNIMDFKESCSKLDIGTSK